MDGECKTQPSLRYPILRQGYMARTVKAALLARTSPESEGDTTTVHITDQSMYLFMDCYKHDNTNVVAKCFVLDDRRLPKSRES